MTAPVEATTDTAGARAHALHWPEYGMEAAGLGLFMLSACSFNVLLEHPASFMHQAIAEGAVRRALMGVAMALTAMAIVYSPWGQQSGAHLNPAVTLSFWRLGRIKSIDALGYMLAQIVGALGGVAIAYAVWGDRLAHPLVRFAATVPGATRLPFAFAAEFAISCLLMAVVLVVSGSRLANWTGVFAGTLVGLFITFEAPFSGMSMNPARSLGSALPAHAWEPLWIYFLAPPLGMLLAARLGRSAAGCAKLIHTRRTRCIHCGAGPALPSR